MHMPACTESGCSKSASYAVKYMQPIYCSEHGKQHGAKPQTYVCLCGSSRPNFGLEDDERPSCCAKCKTDIMKDMRDNRCKEEGCTKRASYEIKGVTKASYCAIHKKDAMIAIHNKLCDYENCIKFPIYGFTEAIRCLDHKLPGMFDVKHKPCIVEGCKERPAYGSEFGKPTHCMSHKSSEMINVVSKRCKHTDCNSVPTYGLMNGKATHCLVHKTDEMKDVKHMKCKVEDCEKRSTHGLEREKPLYCSIHKLPNMLDVSSRMCVVAGCITRANFGLKTTSTHCFTHKTEDMKDNGHKNQLCPGPPGASGADGKCPIQQRGTSKYDGFCTTCFPIAFPDDQRTKTIKKNSHELIVREYLRESFPELNFVHDKPLWTHNCECIHRRRIDLRTIIDGVMLAVEVDEHQHKYKDSKDEEIRYDDVFMLHSGKWIFVRYNPHIYFDEKGKRKNPQKAERLLKLKALIDNILIQIKSEKNNELVEIHKLFYDNFPAPTV
jgi:hypothetical protein